MGNSSNARCRARVPGPLIRGSQSQSDRNDTKIDKKDEEDRHPRCLQRCRPEKHQHYTETKKNDRPTSRTATSTRPTKRPRQLRPCPPKSSQRRGLRPSSTPTTPTTRRWGARAASSIPKKLMLINMKTSPIRFQFNPNPNPIQIQSKSNPIQSNPIRLLMQMITDADDYDCLSAESVLQTQLMALWLD